MIFLISYSIQAFGTEVYVVIDRNNKKGLADSNGKILIPAKYDGIGWSQGVLDTSGEVIGYKVNQTWGLISIHNKIITPALYSELFRANDEAIIAAKKGQFSQKNFFGLLDHQGRNLSGFQFTDLSASGSRIIGIYREGTNHFYGVLDSESKVIISFKYKRISRINEFLFLVQNEQNRNAIFSNDGTDLTGFIIDRIKQHNGFLIISSLGKEGVLDLKGKLIFPPEYAEIFIDQNQPKALAISTWHILDRTGKSITTYTAERMAPFSAKSWKIAGSGYEGIMNTDGKMLTNHEISKIGALQDDVAEFESFGKYGLIRSTGKIIIPPLYDSLIYFGEFAYGHMNTRNGTGWMVMDTFAVTKSKILYDDIRPFPKNFFAVQKKGKWGFINRTGEEIVACVYDEVGVPKENLVEVKFHGEYGIITLQNEWVVLPKKYPVELTGDSTYLLKNPYQNTLYNFKDEMIYFTDYILKNEGGYLSERIGDSTIWFIDLGGRIVDQNSPMTTIDYDDGNITIVRRNSRLGAMDNHGNVIISFENNYQELYPPSEGYFGIRKTGLYGFIDFKNRLMIANRYEAIKPFTRDLAAVRIRNKWGFINKKDQIAIQPFYDEVESFDFSLSIVKKDGKFGLLKTDGNLEQPLEFDKVERTENGKYLVEKGGKLGLLDQAGRQIIFPKFDEISDTGTGFLIVRKDGKYGTVALNGVAQIPPVYDQLIYDHEKGVYLAKIKGLWSIK